jgi:cysteine desulfurase/selenocysteine lyase
MKQSNGPEASALAEEFPSLERWTYVNHAAVSPWPIRTRRAVEAFARENEEDGPAGFRHWITNEQRLRERAARLLGAQNAEDIGLVANTTEGVNIVAHGLEWRPGDNVVTVAGEFPTNHLPWAALVDRGVEVRAVDVRAAQNAEQALIEAMDEQTRVLTVSAVQWTDGFRLQLGTLGAACRGAGVLFFVDAIQQFGALRIDVDKEQIDCLAAGGHKWQMGPEGLGLFYCRSEWRSRIEPPKQGWRMLDRPFSFDQVDRPMHSGSARYEGGTPNTLGQFALNASLSLQEDWGQKWIESRVLANTDRLMVGLADLPGVELVSSQDPERRSGIVSLLPLRGSSRKLARSLYANRIVAAPRGELLRLSPHCYQSMPQIENILESIEKAITTD